MFLPLLTANAQEEKPKVGLVLSGGGAKGLAHIGVLKVLEEAGVRVDLIGGTSMGAIVGGLYAAGYTPQQLDSIFQETNFNMLIQDELPRSARSLHERRDAERYAITLPFDDFNISVPSAFSKGQNVYNLMSRLTLPLEEKHDFSKLPIPFFAVATDVETGEEVILDQGYLPQVISASSAIPSLFNPVMMNGRLLTDGGVSNNYPVEELRRRGADIVIGVDVQDSLVGRENLKSAFEILTQISNFRTIKDMKNKIGKTDVYINPDIKPFSIMSFDRGNEIIEAGKIAAEEKLEELKKIAALQAKNPLPERRPMPVVDTLFISDIRVEGNTSYPRAYILGKLKIRFPEAITYEDIRLGINNLSATRNFNRINYRLEPLNDGYVMRLQLEENFNKTLVRLGVHYDNIYESAALVNLTRKSLFVPNDIVSFDVALGDNFRYYFDYYIDKGFYWSIGARSRFNSFDTGVGFDFLNENAGGANDNIKELQLDYEDLTNQIYIETLFKKTFSLGLGIEHKLLDISSRTLGGAAPGEGPRVFDSSNYYSGFGHLKLDSYDNKYFPGSGFLFEGDFHYYLYATGLQENLSPFSVVRGSLGYAYSPLDNFSARISSETGFRIGTAENNIFDFFLGGYGNDFINNFVPFYGYDFIDLSGDSYIKALVELDYEIFRKNHIILSANFANVENGLYDTGHWFSLPEYSGYAIGYGLETFLGPVEAKYSFAPSIDQSQWFFSIGFWF